MALFPFSFMQSQSPYDPDAAAFFARVAAAGGALSNTEKTATNQLVLDMKSYGIWTSMKAIYPMVGASAAACAQNLVSASFTGSFSSGWTFSSTGVTGNGTSSYFDTGLIPSSNLSQNNTSLSYYIANNYTYENKDIICSGAGSNFIGSYNSSGMEVAVNDYFSPILLTSQKIGLFTFSRIVLTQTKLYINNLETFTNTILSTTLNSSNVIIGCLNVNGTYSRYITNNVRFAHLGDGLTDTQASNFYTAVQAFQTTLSRQV